MTDPKFPHPLAFISAGKKLQWGNEHVNSMILRLQDFHNNAPRGVFAQDGTIPGSVTIGVDFGNFLPLSQTLELMAGDAVHNLRSALDHVACSIVKTYETPPRDLYFPIADGREKLQQNKSFQLIQRHCAPLADLVINEIKPYGEDHPLRGLHQLDIADKHRNLLAPRVGAAVKLLSVSADDEVPEDAADVFLVVNNRPAKPGSKVADHNERHRETIFAILFDDGLPFGREPVIPTLQYLAREVQAAIQAIVTFCINMASDTT